MKSKCTGFYVSRQWQNVSTFLRLRVLFHIGCSRTHEMGAQLLI
jgi:hypothetical protein